MVNESAHPNRTPSGDDIVESAVVVYEIFLTGNARSTNRNAQGNAQCFKYDSMQVWILLQLNPTELVGFFIFELLPQTCELLGLR